MLEIPKLGLQLIARRVWVGLSITRQGRATFFFWFPSAQSEQARAANTDTDWMLRGSCSRIEQKGREHESMRHEEFGANTDDYTTTDNIIGFWAARRLLVRRSAAPNQSAPTTDTN